MATAEARPADKNNIRIFVQISIGAIHKDWHLYIQIVMSSNNSYAFRCTKTWGYSSAAR